MSMLAFILAALLIGLLVYRTTKKDGMSSNRALPLAALLLYFLLLGYFEMVVGAMMLV